MCVSVWGPYLAPIDVAWREREGGERATFLESSSSGVGRPSTNAYTRQRIRVKEEEGGSISFKSGALKKEA